MMRAPTLLTAALGLTLALSGCGLHPLYAGGSQGAVATALSGVEVAPIQGKAGWLMANALRDRLGNGQGGGARYRLDVKLDDQIKGLGVRRWDSVEAFAEWITSPDYEPSPDGITLLQELLVGRDSSITRAEFVAGDFVYAVRVDTSAGSFELCPAEACAIPGADGVEPEPLFRLRDDVDPALLDRYLAFLAAEGVGIAGIEFIETRDGRTVTYDVNTNTNYNPAAEAEAGLYGMKAIAAYLGRELEALTASKRAA